MSGTFKKVVYGTDFSKNADAAFEHARHIAELENGHLYILHVVPEFRDYEKLPPERVPSRLPMVKEKTEKHLTGEYLSKCKPGLAEVVVKFGIEAEQIGRFAEQEKADLIVIGARGISFFEGFLGGGSVADKVLRASKIPVLIVPV